MLRFLFLVGLCLTARACEEEKVAKADLVAKDIVQFAELSDKLSKYFFDGLEKEKAKGLVDCWRKKTETFLTELKAVVGLMDSNYTPCWQKCMSADLILRTSTQRLKSFFNDLGSLYLNARSHPPKC